jgi:hypothetical protein
VDQIESYIVIVLFITLNGMICGSVSGLTDFRSESREKTEAIPFSTLILGFVTPFYGVMWGWHILGKNFIWLPGLLAWNWAFLCLKNIP